MPQPEQLPGPNADIWNWQLQGLCRGVDSSMFFNPDGERGRARMQREQRAKEMCRQCPVIQQCRSHALDVGEPYGVWGGLSESERVRIFDKFYRGKDQRYLVRGTGMGLPIAKAIIAAHKGTISVTSQLGHGSVFSFTLPAERRAGDAR